MTTTRQWLLIGLLVSVGALGGYHLGRPKPVKVSCLEVKRQALISQKAAEVCTSALVGCSLSYDQVRVLVEEVNKAETCE